MSQTTINQLAKYLSNLNPSIDTTDPIIQDGIIKFGANVIDDAKTRVASLNTRFTSAFLNQLSDSELDYYAYNNHGITRKPGTPVTGYIYLMFNSVSDALNPVAANSLVSTSDGKWSYFTTQGVVIDSSTLGLLYNPVKGQFEVRIPVQAIKIGTDYRAAKYRINRLQSTLNFSARVENREAFTTGTNPETRESFIARIQKLNAGFDVNSLDGFLNSLKNTLSDVSDIVMVHQDGQRNAYDVYYIGYKPAAELLEIQVQDPSKKIFDFPWDKTPIRFVDSVAINNVAISPSLFQYSTQKLYLAPEVGLTSSDLIQISYQYNKLNLELYEFLENKFDFTGARWTLREGIPDLIRVTVRVKPQSYLTINETQDLVEGTLLEAINVDQFDMGIQAENLRTLIKSTHPSVLDCQISINDAPFYELAFGHFAILTRDNLTFKELE